jgi:UDP-N-acetylmuramyl pentapeptide phosphotransferase/UDP-N-acetylglucosamine-1-phosphate transferase
MTGDAALPSLAAAAVVAVFVHLAGLVWARLAQRHGWIDRPGERRLHARPTPRGGGIGIAVVLVISLALAAATLGPWLALGALVVTAAGLADDLRPLPPALKLVLQTIGVAAAGPALAVAAGTAR